MPGNHNSRLEAYEFHCCQYKGKIIWRRKESDIDCTVVKKVEYIHYTHRSRQAYLELWFEILQRRASQKSIWRRHWAPSIFTFLTCYFGFFLSSSYAAPQTYSNRSFDCTQWSFQTYIQLYYEMLNGYMFCRFTSILFRIQTWMIFNITNFQCHCH